MSESEPTPLSWVDTEILTKCNPPVQANFVSVTGSASYRLGGMNSLPSTIAMGRALLAARDAADRAVESWVQQACAGYCPQGCRCKYERLSTTYTSDWKLSGPLTWIGWGGTWTWTVTLWVYVSCWKP